MCTKQLLVSEYRRHSEYLPIWYIYLYKYDINIWFSYIGLDWDSCLLCSLFLLLSLFLFLFFLTLYLESIVEIVELCLLAYCGCFNLSAVFVGVGWLVSLVPKKTHSGLEMLTLQYEKLYWLSNHHRAQWNSMRHEFVSSAHAQLAGQRVEKFGDESSWCVHLVSLHCTVWAIQNTSINRTVGCITLANVNSMKCSERNLATFLVRSRSLGSFIISYGVCLSKLRPLDWP